MKKAVVALVAVEEEEEGLEALELQLKVVVGRPPPRRNESGLSDHFYNLQQEDIHTITANPLQHY